MSARLRVALDATPLLGSRTGVGNFTAGLLRELGTRADVEATAFPLSVRGRQALHDVVPPGIRVIAPPLPARALRELWMRTSAVTLDLLLGRPDVIHGTNFLVPPSKAARVVTVHDLTTVRYPQLCHPDTLVYPALIQRAADEGAFVHTVSHAVRDEVLDHFRIDADRVIAVPNGFDAIVGDAAVGRKVAGVRDYVLAVGTVEPRKDLPTLVGAVDAVAAAHPDLVVVHVGGDGWGLEAFEVALAHMTHRKHFRRLGRVDEQTLADLYAGARVLAFPSVYEGFGLPVLEAMSAGVPVVSTDVPAIREVAADAAALCPVGDRAALAEALTMAWTDADWRARMVAAGRERCDRYSWSRCADGLVDLYRLAAGSGPGASGP